MRIGVAFVLALLTTGGSSHPAAQALGPSTPMQTVSAINAQGALVRLQSVALRTVDGHAILHVDIVNEWDERLVRLETTAIVYDAIGRRRGVQVDDIAVDDLPDGGATVGVDLPVRDMQIADNDQVRIGITAAASPTHQWTNGRLVADVDKTFESPDVIVLNPDDAPASVVDVQVIRSAAGAPVAVRATVQNRRQEPIVANRLEIIVFSSAGIIRARLFKPDSRVIPPLASRASEVLVTAPPDAKAKIVVALVRASTPTENWENLQTREQAEARLHTTHRQH
jgi:hypothetical protein